MDILKEIAIFSGFLPFFVGGTVVLLKVRKTKAEDTSKYWEPDLDEEGMKRLEKLHKWPDEDGRQNNPF